MHKFKGHTNSEIENIKVRPSEQLLKLIDSYPTTNAAANFLGLSFATLDSFVKGKGGISLNNAGQIISRTKLSFDILFTLEKQKP